MIFQIVFWFLIYALAFNVLCMDKPDKIMILEYTAVIAIIVFLLKGLEFIGMMDVLILGV